MAATLAFVAAGGEMYLDCDRQLAYTQPVEAAAHLREAYRSPPRGQPSPNSTPVRRATSRSRGRSGARPSTAPAASRVDRNRGAPAFRPKQTKPKRHARPVEDRPEWNTDTSPARPSGRRSTSRGRERRDLSHLRPNIDQEVFNRDRQKPRKAWDDSVRMPPDKGSPMRKPFRARPAPQPKLRFKGSPAKRKPSSGFAKAPTARRASGPAGPSRRPRAEFMGVSSYRIQHPVSMADDGTDGDRVLRVPPASAAIYAARDESDSGTGASRSPTNALDNIVARALTSAQDYNVDASASTMPDGTPSSGSSDEVPSLTSTRNESSPWGTLNRRLPSSSVTDSLTLRSIDSCCWRVAPSVRVPAATMETPVSIVTAEEVQSSISSTSKSESQPFSPTAASPPRETGQRFGAPEPEPEPEPVAQTAMTFEPEPEPEQEQ